MFRDSNPHASSFNPHFDLFGQPHFPDSDSDSDLSDESRQRSASDVFPALTDTAQASQPPATSQASSNLPVTSSSSPSTDAAHPNFPPLPWSASDPCNPDPESVTEALKQLAVMQEEYVRNRLILDEFAMEALMDRVKHEHGGLGRPDVALITDIDTFIQTGALDRLRDKFPDE